jgi:hypothetical protein
LQNVTAVQFVSCGFAHLSPNVNDFSNAVILQTDDVQFQVPVLPDMNLEIIEGGSVVQITIPAPPAGTYTAEGWANAATLSISQGIASAGSFDFGVQITVDARNPTRFSWDLVALFPPSFTELRLDPLDQVAPFLGIIPSRNTILGQGLQGYPGPLLTNPQESFVGTLHRFSVPADQYAIGDLLTTLNALTSPHTASSDTTRPNVVFC